MKHAAQVQFEITRVERKTGSITLRVLDHLTYSGIPTAHGGLHYKIGDIVEMPIPLLSAFYKSSRRKKAA
jgi:hypothetical protein